MMNVLPMKTIKRWTCAAAISMPVLAIQAVLPSVVAPLFNDMAIGSAYAEEEKSGDQRKAKRTQAMNQKVYKKLQEVQELIDAKDYAGAHKLIAEVKGGSKPLNDAELSTTLNLEAFIFYNQDKLTDAIKAYKQIVTLEKAPEGTKLAARYSAAQMYFAIEEYSKGVAMLKTWFKASDPTTIGSNAYVLLAQGQYQMQEFDDSIKNVDKAIRMYKEKGKVPKENWYGLQRFLYQEKKDYDKVISILKEMLVHFPKKQYWAQLSAMYGEKEMLSKQLAAYETAYVQNLFESEQDLTRMAYIFLASEVPYKAAKVMDKGIKAKQIEANSKNLELLGNAWRASQELDKAIPVMAKAAAKSDKGELWTRLGTLYLNNDDFQSAADAIKAGLKKGSVKRADQANLALGMAYFNMKDYNSARKAFGEAGKDERSTETAGQWLDYMDKEIERQKSLLED
ncbi:tetratricopeptide repeat protein [Dasania marina]|uniref:tetratricopeptide repeat protein n=1 Tax=Dasania marina TaxID=471499 RepID=UPI001F0B1619|nr:tetratricopeptide repeat protein [Dasania marina]